MGRGQAQGAGGQDLGAVGTTRSGDGEVARPLCERNGEHFYISSKAKCLSIMPSQLPNCHA
jgi:hypothetical protein